MNISRKTTYLLAVATLIITVIGASFAYFTSDIVDGEETIGLIETAKLGRIEYVTNVPEFSGILPGWEGIGYTSIYWISDSTTEASYTCTVNLEEDSYDQNIYIQTIEGEDGVIIEETPLTKEGIVVSRGTLAPETGINPPRTGEKHTVRYKVIFKELGVEQNDEQGKEIKLSSTCFLAPIEPEKHTVKLTVNGGYITTNNLREEERIVYYGGTTVFEIEADLGNDKASARLATDTDYVGDEEENENTCQEDMLEDDEKVCILNEEIVSCDNESYTTCIAKEKIEEEKTCTVKYDADENKLTVSATEVTDDMECELTIPESVYEYVFSSRQLRSFGALKLANYGDNVSESFSQNDLDEAGVVLEGAEVIGENCSLNGTTAEATVYDDGKCEIEFEPKRYTVTFIVNGGKPISSEIGVAYASVLSSGLELPYIEALEGYTTEGFYMNADIDYAQAETSGCKVLGNKITAYVYSDFTCEINLPEEPKEEDISERLAVTVICENCTIKSNQTIKEETKEANVHTLTSEVKVLKKSCNEGTCFEYPSAFFTLLPDNKYVLANPYISCNTSNYMLEEAKNLTINSITKNVTCTIKADPESNILAEKILEDNPVTRVANLAKKSGKESEYELDTGTGSLYHTTSTIDDSEVFYYRGNVKNNWVIFGLCTEEAERLGYTCKKGDALYWRILRTNTEAEGGGVRLIYAGSGSSKDSIPTDSVKEDAAVKVYSLNETINTNEIVYKEKSKTGFSSIKGYIGISAYNTPSTETDYGPYKTSYMGGKTAISLVDNGEGVLVPDKSASVDDLKSNTYSSSIKTYIENWYRSIFTVSYGDLIYGDYVNANAVYCSNRDILKKQGSGVTDDAEDKDTYYKDYDNTYKNYYYKCLNSTCSRREYLTDVSGNLIRKGKVYFGTSYNYDNPDDDTEDTRVKDAYNSNNPNPTLKCDDVRDQFSSKDSNIGNKNLEYAVALISADETYFAGGKKGYGNSSMWLNQDATYNCRDKKKPCGMSTLEEKCNIVGAKCKYEKGVPTKLQSLDYVNNAIIGSSRWWTMTPAYYKSSKDPRRDSNRVYTVNGKGTGLQNSFSAVETRDYYFVRPVLSLIYETYTKSGNGTAEKPYIFSEYPEFVVTITCKNCKINDTLTSYSKSVEAYKDITFDLKADEGYMIRRANTSGGCYISNNRITTGDAKIDSVSRHMTCAVEAVPLEYDLTLSGSGFEYVSSSYSSAAPTQNAGIEIRAKEGYDISTVTTSTAGCTVSGNGDTRTVTATNLTWDKTCALSIEKYKYKVTVNVTGGASDPVEYDVPWGENKSFTISADVAYNINTLALVSGNCTLNGTTLTVTNVKETRTCNLSMNKKTFTVGVSVTNGSTTSENPQTIEYGEPATFAISANEGYDITSTSTNTSGCEVIENGTKVRISSVTSNKTCNVSLSKLVYTVKVTCNYCSSKPTSASVEWGEGTQFTITQNSGYTLSGANVSGTNCKLDGSTLTVTDVKTPTTCTITAKSADYYLYWSYSSNVSVNVGISNPFGSTTSNYRESTTISGFISGAPSSSYIAFGRATMSNGVSKKNETCLIEVSTQKYVCFDITENSNATIKTKMENTFGSSNVKCGTSSSFYYCSLGSSITTKPYVRVGSRYIEPGGTYAWNSSAWKSLKRTCRLFYDSSDTTYYKKMNCGN